MNPLIQILQIRCWLGSLTYDVKSCKCVKDLANKGVVFNNKDMEKMTNNLIDIKNSIYLLYKEGISVYFKKNENNSFSLEKIRIKVKINPSVTKSIQTPINIITELNNNDNGTNKLRELKIIEQLLDYIDPKKIEKYNNRVKSALWILAKLLIKDYQGELIEGNYKIINKIMELNKQCDDYAMKGTILYILCYISQNKNLKYIIDSYNYSYFPNTDICYPNDMKDIYMEKKEYYINRKLNDEISKINKFITLNPKTEEIYNNITNLINNISYKQANSELNTLHSTSPTSFFDINLFVKIYILLCKYKFKLSARKNILTYIENDINSNEMAKKVYEIFSDVGKIFLDGYNME